MRPARPQHLPTSIVVALLVTLGVVGSAWEPAAVLAQSCNWSGTWRRTEGSGPTVTLTQSGNQVTGDDGVNDLISGTVSGNRFTGRWTHGSDGGALDLTIDGSCNSISGTFGWAPPRQPDPFHATRLTSAAPSAPPTATVPPRPPAPPPTAVPPPNPAPPPTLGGVDLNSYCQNVSYDFGDFQVWPFDGAALTQGIWSCVGSDSFGLGITLDQQVDLNDACRWQYNLPNAVARQSVAGDPNSWRCDLAD